MLFLVRYVTASPSEMPQVVQTTATCGTGNVSRKPNKSGVSATSEGRSATTSRTGSAPLRPRGRRSAPSGPTRLEMPPTLTWLPPLPHRASLQRRIGDSGMPRACLSAASITPPTVCPIPIRQTAPSRECAGCAPSGGPEVGQLATKVACALRSSGRAS